MAIIAGAALGVAGAATSAAGAAKGKKGGGAIPGVPDRSLSERLLGRGIYDILDTERSIIDDALAQGNFLQPDMYRVLGFEPIYDEADTAGIEELSARVEELRGRADAKVNIKEELRAVKDDQTLSKREKREQTRALRRDLRRAPGHIKQSKKDLARAQSDLERAQAMPRRIVGIRPLDEFDPSGSKGGAFREAFDLQSQSLVRALKGEEPIDPTLKSTFDERERTLREQLRRQFGSDFESSEAARQVLSNFDREKAEAFVQYNREQVTSLSELSENRAIALSNLTSSRLDQLQAPVEAQLGRAGALDKYIGTSLSVIDRNQRERQLQLEASQAQFDARLKNTMAKSEALKGIGSGISSAGGSIAGAAS